MRSKQPAKQAFNNIHKNPGERYSQGYVSLSHRLGCHQSFMAVNEIRSLMLYVHDTPDMGLYSVKDLTEA